MSGRGRIAILVTVLVLGLADTLKAEATLEEIVMAIEKQSQAVKNMSCKLEMDINFMGQKMKISGSMKVQMPDRVWADLEIAEQGIKMKIVSDGTTMFQEVKVMGQTMVNKVDLKAVKASGGGMPGMNFGGGMGGMVGPQDPAKVLAELKKMMDLKVLPEEKLDGRKMWVLHGKFKPDQLKAMSRSQAGGAAAMEMMKSFMATMKLYVGQKSHYLEKMEFLSSNGTPTMTMRFRDMVFNQEIPQGTFRYEVPDGAVVNDGTQKMVAQVKVTEKATPKTTRAIAREKRELPTTVLRPGDDAPDFSVKTLSGETVELAKLKGKPVLLAFWSTWQRPSAKQLKDLNLLSRRFGQVRFLAVSLDEPGRTDEVKQFVREKGITIPVTIDQDDVLDDYGITQIPAYVLIGADGTVVHGEQKSADLKSVQRAIEVAVTKAAR